MRVEGLSWSGRLEEPDFLNRIFDLESLPSTDSRFRNAYGDIWQHRVRNEDWGDDWVFSDRRFNLLRGEDEVFLRFLCELLHPVVRPDASEVERLRQLFNEVLRQDGYQLVEKSRLSGRPVFVARRMDLQGTSSVKMMDETFRGTDSEYVLQQITRMEVAINHDPDLAIGTAKELVETVCKTIIREREEPIPRNADLPQLVKQTAKLLQLTPDDIPEEARASQTIRRLLSNFAVIARGVAELRNLYGTGHGRDPDTKGLQPRHAKLAVGAASTLAVFLLETHQARSERGPG